MYVQVFEIFVLDYSPLSFVGHFSLNVGEDLVIFLSFVLISFFSLGFFTNTLKLRFLQWCLCKFIGIVLVTFRKQLHGHRSPIFAIGFFVFIFIFFVNYISLLPFGFTLSAQLLFVFFPVLCIFIALCLRLATDHLVPFLAHLIPAGTPLAIRGFLCIIEIISFFFRAISLGTRLFANMVAGHVLLGLISVNLWLLSLNIELFLSKLGLVTLILGWCSIFVLECLVAFLQAYVLVTMIFIYFEDLGSTSNRLSTINLNLRIVKFLESLNLTSGVVNVVLFSGFTAFSNFETLYKMYVTISKYCMIFLFGQAGVGNFKVAKL